MDPEHIPITGGCLCGAVRYESREKPTEGYYCHCSMCQKHYGGLFGATIKVAQAALKYTKVEPTFYCSSNVAQRGFCAKCGSPIAFIHDALPFAWISIGSLDHPEEWPLTKAATWGQITHLQVDSKVPWLDIDDGLPQEHGGPFRAAAEASTTKPA